jgi:rhodanese-related sulfurtransferase
MRMIAGAMKMNLTLNPVDVKDVDPREAWSVLQAHPDAVLVDVRTKAEWTYVGLPKLDSVAKQPVLLEWQTYPSMAINTSFVTALKAALTQAGRGPDTAIYFLCRSGVRSKAAAMAMAEAGWTSCFNIAGGFEGNPDSSGQRGKLNGWKAAGLPWSQM